MDLIIIGTLAVVSLCIGSFLNVVIYRLPIMMKRQWQEEYREFFNLPDESTLPKVDLCFPASHCTHCNHTLTIKENIPLLSFLFLRGKCRHCRTAISWQYPIVEATTLLLSLIVFWHFGLSWQTACALLLTWSLIAMAAIDIHHQLIPDSLTLPLIWFGLLINLKNIFTTLDHAVIGAAVAYLSLWAFIGAFKLLTGKEGMGRGDFKLFALFGAWLGWQTLPFIIITASFVGAIVGIITIMCKGQDKNTPIPFGPFLAIAGWIALLWGDQILTRYLALFHL